MCPVTANPGHNKTGPAPDENRTGGIQPAHQRRSTDVQRSRLLPCTPASPPLPTTHSGGWKIAPSALECGHQSGQSHHPQGGADRPLARRQHRAGHQDQHTPPDRRGETVAERRQPSGQQERHGGSAEGNGAVGMRSGVIESANRTMPVPQAAPAPCSFVATRRPRAAYNIVSMTDGIVQRIERFLFTRCAVLVERRNRVFTLSCRLRCAGRLRPNADDDRVEVLYWSIGKERWSPIGPFGRTVLPLEDAPVSSLTRTSSECRYDAIPGMIGGKSSLPEDSVMQLTGTSAVQGRENVSTHPYRNLPDHAFWRRAVAEPPIQDVDPVIFAPFLITSADRIATAGSCFAQHIGRHLRQAGFELACDRDRTSDCAPQSR